MRPQPDVFSSDDEEDAFVGNVVYQALQTCKCATQHHLGRGYYIAVTLHPKSHAAYWAVFYHRGTRIVAGGFLKGPYREVGGPVHYVEKNAAVLPGHRNKGLYTQVLPYLANTLGYIQADDARTGGCIAAWEKAGALTDTDNKGREFHYLQSAYHKEAVQCTSSVSC